MASSPCSWRRRFVGCAPVLIASLFAAPTAAQTVLTSGLGPPGGNDPSITVLAGPFTGPFTAADFAAAQAGPAATIVANIAGGWPASIPTAPLAQWIDAVPAGAQGLFAVDFDVNAPFQNARLTIEFAVDDFLGTSTEPGLYLNGQPITGSEGIGTYFRVDRYAFDVGPLLTQGTNTLYLFGNNTGGAGGLMFEASIELDPAVLLPYGVGCAGSNGVPILSPGSGLPRLGQSFTLNAWHLPTTPGPMFIALGDSNASWLGFPIPVDLAPFGVGGCDAWIDLQDAFPAVHSGGFGTWTTSIPNQASLVGLAFYAQALIPDSGAGNPAQATTSSAVELRIGR